MSLKLGWSSPLIKNQGWPWAVKLSTGTWSLNLFNWNTVWLHWFFSSPKEKVVNPLQIVCALPIDISRVRNGLLLLCAQSMLFCFDPLWFLFFLLLYFQFAALYVERVLFRLRGESARPVASRITSQRKKTNRILALAVFLFIWSISIRCTTIDQQRNSATSWRIKVSQPDDKFHRFYHPTREH